MAVDEDLGDSVLQQITATKILWKAGKNATIDIVPVKEKVGGPGGGSVELCEQCRPSLFSEC